MSGTISKNNVFYRIGYFWTGAKSRPKSVNLCRLFWAVAISMICSFLACGACLVLFLALFKVLYDVLMHLTMAELRHNAWEALVVIGWFVAIIVASIALIAARVMYKNLTTEETGAFAPLSAFIKAKKQKVCPVWEVV